MAQDTIEELPDTWSEFAQRVGVPQQVVSQTMRHLMAVKQMEVPARAPPPRELGRPFVAELTEVITRTSVTRKVTIRQKRTDRAELEKIVRDCLDKHQELLCDNLIETVSDELKLPVAEVQKVVETRLRALECERKVKAKLAAFAAEDAARVRARDLKNSALAADEREAVHNHREATGRRVEGAAPKIEVRTHSIPETPMATPPRRSPKLPEPQEDLDLDGFLRAAWVAKTAGVPHAAEDATEALQKRFAGLTAQEALDAIEHAYASGSERRRRTMEGAAKKLVASR